MNSIIQKVVERLAEDKRLRGVPFVVIEEVVTQSVQVFGDLALPEGTKVDQLDDDWQICNGCKKLLLAEDLRQLVEDGPVFCVSCFDTKT